MIYSHSLTQHYPSPSGLCLIQLNLHSNITDFLEPRGEKLRNIMAVYMTFCNMHSNIIDFIEPRDKKLEKSRRLPLSHQKTANYQDRVHNILKYLRSVYLASRQLPDKGRMLPDKLPDTDTALLPFEHKGIFCTWLIF